MIQMTREKEWPYVLSLMPADLEESAQATGALLRKRVVKSAGDLMRLVLAYSLRGLSLRGVSAWSDGADVAKLSDVAVLKRLRKCGDWLSHIITQKLRKMVEFPECEDGLNMRLVDATCVNRPGSKGTDWRVHLCFDLRSMRIEDVQLTGPEGAETLRRFRARPGDILTGDRAYGERKAIAQVKKAGADVLVRISWQNMPLENPDGSTFDILGHARTVEDTKPGDWPVRIRVKTEDGAVSVDGRLVALRKSPEAAERERRKVRKQYSKNGKTPDARTLEACDYILLFTTLPMEKVSATKLLELYRFRWQIELVFKRLKGILKLDEMKACSNELCRTFILGKMLAAILVEELAGGTGVFSPWGYGRPSPVVPQQTLPGDIGHALRSDLCCTQPGNLACWR